MLLDCSRCGALVDAIVLHSYEDNESDPNEPPGLWTFAKCPKCTLPLVAVQVDMGGGFAEDSPSRVYPPTERQLGFAVPESIRTAFNEAATCFRAKAYTASAIMCRKALEGLCLEHGVKERTLSANLKKLKENGVIEARLFEWAEALRTLGNEAAHGVTATISLQDAKDILEFTEALSEYVFTYRDKFEKFKNRRKAKAKDSGGAES